MRIARSLGLLAAMLAASPPALPTQARLALDVGGGTASHGAPAASAFAAGAGLQVGGARAALAADARLLRFGGDATSSWWTVEGLLRTSARRGVRGEVLGEASAVEYRGYPRSARQEVRAGVGLTRGSFGGALHAGLARVSPGGGRREASVVDLLLQRAIADLVVSLSAARIGFRDSGYVRRDTTYMVAGYPFRGHHQVLLERRRRYVDAEATFNWSSRYATVDAGLGFRRGDRATVRERWVRVRGVVPVGRVGGSSALALVAEGGRRPAVPEQALPSGRYATLSLRLTPGARRTPPPRTLPGAPVVAVVELSPGRRTIRVSGVTAERVEIMGDFTDWLAVDLSRVGPGVWQLDRTIPAGSHRMSFRTDGGSWQVPPGLPIGADEFAGAVGVLVIE